MRTTRWTTLVARTLGLAVVLTLALAPVAHAAVPSAPTIRDAWVSAVGKVTVRWDASVDASSHALGYRIYRDTIPITAATITSRSLIPVATGITGTTSPPINAASAETTQSYTWFYAVVAYHDLPTVVSSAPSANMAPNLHGFRNDPTIVSCGRCHQVHGAYLYDYRTKELCYTCHGNTSAVTATGAKSTYNVQREFSDYTTATIAGSRHRNQYMLDNKTGCIACHSSHRTSYLYDASGVYQASSSYRMMLRVKYAAATYNYYSKNSAPAANNEFCLSCHGSTVIFDGKTVNASASIALAGGPSAFAATGGDHNTAGYAASAHGGSVIYSNDYPATDKPGVQCEVCHDNHGSATKRLIDYRRSHTADPNANKQANLCFKCHSATSTETKVAAGFVKPFAWNGRDVEAQFKLASHHPTVAVGAAAAEAGSWSQTTQGDFAGDALTNATAVTGGSGTSGAVQLTSLYANTVTALTEGFEDGTWTTDFPGNVGGWATNTNWSPGGAYSIRAGNGTTPDTLTSRVMSLNGWTNVTVSFDWERDSIDATEYLRVQYSTDGNTWASGWSVQGDGSWGAVAGTGSFQISAPTATTYIRLVIEGADTGEYGSWDDITVTGDQPGGYSNTGSAVSTVIPAGLGTVSTWGTVTYTGATPAGSQMLVDVLNANNDAVLLSGVSSGASLSSVFAPSLKLRARFTGDAPAARVVSDNFDNNSFDTAKWSDRYLNSTDPDAAYAAGLGFITFPTALLNATTGMDSRTPDLDATGWYRNTGTGSDGNAGYARTGTGANSGDRIVLKSFGDLSALTSVDASFDWRNGVNGTGAMTTDDYLYVEWTPNGGTNWYTINSVTATTSDTSFGQLSATGLAVGTNCQLRLRAKVQDAANDSWYVDTINVTGNYPAGSAWPKETGGQLSLRAEGTDFGGTADEGEFTYIQPATATWISTQDFDTVVRVPSYSNLGADPWMKAGLMVRTGTTEANAYANGAIMAGLYVTDTNGVGFQSRTAVNGATSANVAGSGDAPVYLKLTRRGSVITGYQSADGSSWTVVGSQTIGLSTYVLTGVCLTSHVNGTFSEATFDDFSVTESTGASTVTPRLDDWTVTYQWIPAPTGGSLTCVNCHNVHYNGRGTVGTAWQMVRAALPSNTKTNYTGTPTQFCLECHDGTPPAAATTETTVVPFAVGFSAQTVSPYFPGWNKEAGTNLSFSQSGHMTAANGKALCETCHDPHGSNNQRLGAWTRPAGATTWVNNLSIAGSRVNTGTVASEENLCYKCHGNGTAPYPRANGALDVYTKSNLVGTNNKHVMATYAGRHTDTETAASLASRHSECVDCHDPHSAKKVAGSALHTAKSSIAGGAVYGAWGTSVTYATSNWGLPSTFTPVRLAGGPNDLEAYLCFKCHSSNTTAPAAQTNIAREFNPSNFSFHNVLGQSKGMQTNFTFVDTGGGTTSVTWSLPAASTFLRVADGWTTDSMMTCTSCHTNEQNSSTEASGPHGSSAKWIIDPAYPRDWRTVGLNGETGVRTYGMAYRVGTTYYDATDVICAKCHDLNGASTTANPSGNNAHSRMSDHSISRADCVSCHVAIPHGWRAPRLLLTRSAAGTPYLATTARTPVTELGARTHSPTGWAGSDCKSSCAGNHDTATAPYWP